MLKHGMHRACAVSLLSGYDVDMKVGYFLACLSSIVNRNGRRTGTYSQFDCRSYLSNELKDCLRFRAAEVLNLPHMGPAHDQRVADCKWERVKNCKRVLIAIYDLGRNLARNYPAKDTAWLIQQ
jgi:hypothetical protein